MSQSEDNGSEDTAWPPAISGDKAGAEEDNASDGKEQSNRAALSCVWSVFLVIGGLYSLLLAFGIMMGDRAPGIKVDRSPAVWLTLAGIACLVGAVWLVVRAVAYFLGRR